MLEIGLKVVFTVLSNLLGRNIDNQANWFESMRGVLHSPKIL